ncbi:efflux transporter outer membrane subunit [Aeoliella sp.]|uniref:efflux transporter outer membrane subunit n=1 Tax=Aeoliella sp. TaxID=2795800 RepID=UPI003CCB9FAB
MLHVRTSKGSRLCNSPVQWESLVTLPRHTSTGLRQLMAGLAVGLLLNCTGCTGIPGASISDWWRHGCKVGPEYCEPAAPVAPQWIDADDQRVTDGYPSVADWWNQFNDPVLNELVQSAYRQNITLREAGMRVLEVRAQRGIAVGNLFPQAQSLDAQYSRRQLSGNLANDLSGVVPNFSRNINDWSLAGNLSWELDFWGRFRRSIEAAEADLDASVENYDDVLASLVAEVASTYVNIRTLQQQLQYARQSVDLQRGSLQIAESRYDNGAVTQVDVEQAKLVLSRTEALIPQLNAALRKQNNQLCVLLGMPATDLLPQLGESPIPTAPANIALGVPAELLRRRPDVRRAEREVAAQSALIGVAVADLFPSLSINGNIGYESAQLDRLFVPASNVGVIAPSINWDVLNYGRLKNNVRVHQARTQKAALAYQDTVLRANREAEDGVTEFLNSHNATLHLKDSVAAAERSAELLAIQYKQGAIGYNRVFTVQDILVQQQQNYATSQGDIALGLINIYRALGGGWQIRFGAGNVAAAPMEIIEPAPAEVVPPAGDAT